MQIRLRPLFLAIAATLATLPIAAAVAHPLGNFSVNYYSRIEVGRERVRIYYINDLAEIPTFQLKKIIDTNGDATIDAGEQQAYLAQHVEQLRGNLSLKVNGKTLTLSASDPRMTFSPGQGGLETLHMAMWFEAPSPAADKAVLEFDDGNDRDRLGWREIIARGVEGVTLAESSVPETDKSKELTDYPTDLLSSPLTVRSARMTLSTGGLTAAPVASAEANRPVFGSSRFDAQFSALITQDVSILAVLTALVLGALHALEPGHGKSVAAAYLVGTRATPRHAVLLGLTVTITHTFTIFVMGFVTLFLSNYIVPEKLFPYLGLISAGLVIAMGIQMIVNAIRSRRAVAPDAAADHAHDMDPNTGKLAHAHGGKTHTHVPPSKMNARNVITVGVSGGLVPCPAALIVLLSSIALGRVAFGILLVLIFSIGLAVVLTIVSLIVLYSKKMVNRSGMLKTLGSRLPSSKTMTTVLPMMSGVLVIGAGALLLYNALPFLALF